MTEQFSDSFSWTKETSVLGAELTQITFEGIFHSLITMESTAWSPTSQRNDYLGCHLAWVWPIFSNFQEKLRPYQVVKYEHKKQLVICKCRNGSKKWGSGRRRATSVFSNARAILIVLRWKSVDKLSHQLPHAVSMKLSGNNNNLSLLCSTSWKKKPYMKFHTEIWSWILLDACRS